MEIALQMSVLLRSSRYLTAPYLASSLFRDFTSSYPVYFIWVTP